MTWDDLKREAIELFKLGREPLPPPPKPFELVILGDEKLRAEMHEKIKAEIDAKFEQMQQLEQLAFVAWLNSSSG